jgi:hypothetical protein
MASMSGDAPPFTVLSPSGFLAREPFASAMMTAVIEFV